jgi:hypothetical protein
MIIYKVHTERNLADTSREPDNIVTKEICHKGFETDAISVMEEYIKKNFFHKDTQPIKTSYGWSATDFCSYGETIRITKINVE